MITTTEYLESIIPHGDSCIDCPAMEDGYCRYLEETILFDDKECAINDPRCGHNSAYSYTKQERDENISELSNEINEQLEINEITEGEVRIWDVEKARNGKNPSIKVKSVKNE